MIRRFSIVATMDYKSTIPGGNQITNSFGAVTSWILMDFQMIVKVAFRRISLSLESTCSERGLIFNIK